MRCNDLPIWSLFLIQQMPNFVRKCEKFSYYDIIGRGSLSDMADPDNLQESVKRQETSRVIAVHVFKYRIFVTIGNKRWCDRKPQYERIRLIANVVFEIRIPQGLLRGRSANIK